MNNIGHLIIKNIDNTISLLIFDIYWSTKYYNCAPTLIHISIK